MYDIIVVGAGPAGAMAAKYLAASGQKVLLIQKNLSFKKPCGGGIRLDAFNEFDIDKKWIKSIVNELVLETKQHSIAYDISHIPLAIVDRVSFDKALRNDAREAGAVLLEAKATDIDVTAFGVRVGVDDGVKDKVYEAKYLIAADGVHSFVRKKMRNEEVPAHLTHYSDILALQTNKCHIYFGTDMAKGAYGWRFPHHDGTNIGVPASENKNNMYELFNFLDIKKDEKIRGYKIPVWEDPIFYDKRIFYVGDAAGQVLPCTYEGIYYAMKSAKILSEVIVEDADHDSYEKRWNTLYLKKFSILKRLEKLFLHHDFMINLMMKTVKKPEVQKKVLSLWMDQYEIKINLRFFGKILKNIFIKR